MSENISRTHGGDVTLEDALLSALEEAGVDTVNKDPPLASFLDVVALERLYRESPESLRVQTRIWSRPVSITPDEVRVHEVKELAHGVG